MNTRFLNRRSLLKYCFGSTLALSAGESLSAEKNCQVTGSDDEGPFYLRGAPHRVQITAADEPGQRVTIKGKVISDDCVTALAGANVDVWHADAEGNYHNDKETYRLRGQIKTNAEGEYEFRTIRPGNYAISAGDAWRPAHYHLTVTHPGYKALTTQIYFKGDPHLGPNDACGSECHSDDENRIIELKQIKNAEEIYSGSFDIVLKRHI